MTLTIPANHDPVRSALAAGRRVDAAKAAERAAKSASPERLRELVAILAAEMREIGDKHDKAGRPPMGFVMRRDFALMAAQHDLTRAVMARCILDGDEIGPRTLAMFVFYAGLLMDGENESTDAVELIEARAERLARDPDAAAAALAAVRGYAAETLKELDLRAVPRSGFRAEFRRRMVKRHRVETCAKKLTVPKVSR